MIAIGNFVAVTIVRTTLIHSLRYRTSRQNHVAERRGGFERVCCQSTQAGYIGARYAGGEEAWK